MVVNGQKTGGVNILNGFLGFPKQEWCHPRLPRGEAFRFTPFMQCNGMGYAWVTENGMVYMNVSCIRLYDSNLCNVGMSWWKKHTMKSTISQLCYMHTGQHKRIRFGDTSVNLKTKKS